MVDKANWPAFSQKIDSIKGEFPQSLNINGEAAQIKRIIRKSANEIIPQSRKPKSNDSPAWFKFNHCKMDK